MFVLFQQLPAPPFFLSTLPFLPLSATSPSLVGALQLLSCCCQDWCSRRSTENPRETGSLLSHLVWSTAKSASPRSSCCRALCPYISAWATYVLAADQISLENGYQTLTSLYGVHINWANTAIYDIFKNGLLLGHKKIANLWHECIPQPKTNFHLWSRKAVDNFPYYGPKNIFYYSCY